MSFSYALLKPLLHSLEPETAHNLAIKALSKQLIPSKRSTVFPSLTQELFGLTFANPVGLAAGFDKNAQAVAGLVRMGFGFVEVGTVTPYPQEGNPKPRIFRLREDAAVINRLGFNNEGSEAMLARLQALQAQPIVIGVNIGRNKDSQDTVEDYRMLIERMAEVASYITINISSPNTQGLRNMQQRQPLQELLTAVIETRDVMGSKLLRHLPLLLKIAPDIDGAMKEDIAEIATSYALDGLIISNTTIKRPNTLKSAKHGETGGLSGKPLMEASTALLAQIHGLTGGNIPLIGVGGIASAEDAYQKILAGASLLQIYTAFIYQGFGLVAEINKGLDERLRRDGFATISEAVGKAN